MVEWLIVMYVFMFFLKKSADRKESMPGITKLIICASYFLRYFTTW